MPIPGMIDKEFDFFNKHADYESVFLLWPRREYNTGKLMWFTCVVRATAIWVGPGKSFEEVRYYNAVEYLINQLKQ